MLLSGENNGATMAGSTINLEAEYLDELATDNSVATHCERQSFQDQLACCISEAHSKGGIEMPSFIQVLEILHE